MAQRLVQQVAPVLAPDGAPLWLTDGCKEEATALLTHAGPWVQPARRQAAGPAPQPRWRPLPARLEAPVSQTVRRRRLVRVRPRVVWGTLDAVQHVLAAGGWQLHPAVVACLNRSRRQPVAALGRRVATLGKGADGVGRQRALYPVYDTGGLPHASWRLPWALPEPPPAAAP